MQLSAKDHKIYCTEQTVYRFETATGTAIYAQLDTACTARVPLLYLLEHELDARQLECYHCLYNVEPVHLCQLLLLHASVCAEASLQSVSQDCFLHCRMGSYTAVVTINILLRQQLHASVFISSGRQTACLP